MQVHTYLVYTQMCVYIYSTIHVCVSVCIYVNIYNIIISLHIITLKVSNVYGTFQNCKEELAQHALALKTTIAVAWN
jgi:hypothetical protein